MRRRYERRRGGSTSSKMKPSAISNARVHTQSSPTGSSVLSTTKKRQTMVHAAAQMKLHVHGHEFQNGEEIVLNPESFPQLQEIVWNEYVVEVFHHPDQLNAMQEDLALDYGIHETRTDKWSQNHLLLEITGSSIVSFKGKMQVSVLKETASLFQLIPFKDVTVRFVPKTQVQVDFVEVSLKDHFMSRRDLMYLQQSMVGTTLYVGKMIRVQGTRWQVLDVRAGGNKVRSGVVSDKTKFTFRSRTSRIMWLVQISPEMWDIANSGMLYLDILLTVVRNVLNKWMRHKVSHSLTILFYSRCFYPEMNQNQDVKPTDESYSNFVPKKAHSRVVDDKKESSFPYDKNEYFSIGVDENGRHYQDFYKLVVFDSIITDVQPLLVQLKKALNAFPRECGWRSPASFYVSSVSRAESIQDESRPRPGIPSNARDGNLLEAINLVLNIFEKHHIDRDLSRSGQSVVLITPGNGIFSVNKRLSEITEQRMMDHGIGIDLISLASRPLHKCPLFLFKQSNLSEMKLPGRKECNPATEVCVCNNNNVHGLKSGYQRCSRTSINEAATDPQSIVADTGMRTGQLCKYCLQRMENRKNYIVPLWIPLWFVQENMLIPHDCPLDEDITQFCDVCAPQSSKNKTFEPLPMCRMFRGNDATHFGHLSLPKPLERLLNGFEVTESARSDSDCDNITSGMPPFAGNGSIYDNVVLAGLDSDLVRARASSMTCSDDSLSYDGEVPTKVRAYSLSGHNKLLQEFEKYDDEVFGFATGSKLTQKLSDSDISVRIATTPPLRPGMPHLTSMSKKRTGVLGFHSGSAGNGNENGSSNCAGAYWRQYEQREPSPPNVDMVEYRGSLEAKAGSLGDDKDKPSVRNSSSFPNTFSLGDGSGSSRTPFSSSPVLRPVEVAANEDIFHSQAYMLKQLTSNQRRWSQIRPYEDQQYKIAQNVLKWRSLCFPALLPLASDFMPAPKELQAHYTESFYSVMLPERDEQNGVMFRDYRELVLEMVAQRLSQDFQLVSVEVSSEVGGKAGTVFRLSMGHRIHEIVYNEETQTIDVKRYLQKVTTRSDVDIMEYRYSLWSPIVDHFVAVAQEFRKYPQIEYQWNHLDQLICGYIDDMSEGIRYKRSLYCLFPPRLTGTDVNDQENLQVYTDSCRKFLEFLRVKADISTGFPHVKLSTNWSSDITTSGMEAFKRVSQRSVKMLLQTNDAVTSQNWVIAKVDTEVLPTQCYHIEIQWLVCRSSLVDDLITGMSRRAKQLGLELHRVTENGISSNLDLHPLNCPIFLKIDDPFERREVERTLVERFGFCCEALHPIPFAHMNHNAEYATMAQQRRPPHARRMISYYRQYVHRSLSCFARMTQTGLVWISNQKVHQGDDEIQPIFNKLRQYIDSLQVVRSALVSVLDDMFELAEAGTASLSIASGNDASPKEAAQKSGAAEDSDNRLMDSISASASTASCSEEEKENSPAAINTVADDALMDTKRVLLATTANTSGPDALHRVTGKYL